MAKRWPLAFTSRLPCARLTQLQGRKVPENKKGGGWQKDGWQKNRHWAFSSRLPFERLTQFQEGSFQSKRVLEKGFGERGFESERIPGTIFLPAIFLPNPLFLLRYFSAGNKNVSGRQERRRQ